MKIRMQGAALAVAITSVVLGISELSPAIATTAPAPGGAKCTAMATKFYKEAGRIHLTMNVSCPTPHAAVYLQPIIDRTGGGASHVSWYGTRYRCGSDYGCSHSYSVADVAGKQKWLFMPSPDGTIVGDALLGDEAGGVYAAAGNCAAPQNGKEPILCLQDTIYG